MAFANFYVGHRDKRLFKAYDPHTNTKGREYMNTKIIPHFASFFKDGDKVINIGQHIFWDYSMVFNNMLLRCDYLTTDTDPTQGEPDIIDDITQSKLESDSADGMMLVGMSDVVAQFDKALSEIYRILKPGGRLLVSFHGVTLPGFLEKLKQFKLDELHCVYDPGAVGWTDMYSDGLINSYFALVRKPKAV